MFSERRGSRIFPRGRVSKITRGKSTKNFGVGKKSIRLIWGTVLRHIQKSESYKPLECERKRTLRGVDKHSTCQPKVPNKKKLTSGESDDPEGVLTVNASRY